MSAISKDTRRRARQLRLNMTQEERVLWRRLRELNRMVNLHFRRQAPLGRYIANFAELSRKLLIEVDTCGHRRPEDQLRESWFAGQGFLVLRFRNSEIRDDLEDVLRKVMFALEYDASPPPPSPPHQGEGSRRRDSSEHDRIGRAR